jgi:hypothetical protein
MKMNLKFFIIRRKVFWEKEADVTKKGISTISVRASLIQEPLFSAGGWKYLFALLGFQKTVFNAIIVAI